MSYYIPINESYLKRAGAQFSTPFVGTPSDRVPVDPLIFSASARLFNRTIREFWEGDPAEAITMVAHACEFYDITPIAHYLYGSYWAEDYGAKLKYMETMPPIVVDYPIKEPADVDRFEPMDPKELSKGPTLTKHFRAFDHILKNYTPMFAPVSFFNGATDIASGLVGVEKFLLWIMKQPSICHKLLKKIADHMVNGNIAVRDKYGAVVMVVGSVTANSEILSPKQVKEFNFNYVYDAVKRSLKVGAGPGVYYHLCGDHSLDWQIWKEAVMSPFTVMQIGYEGKGKPFPAKKLKEEFGNKCTIYGCIDSLVLGQRSPAEVYEQGKQQIIDGKDSPRGFIVGNACEIPPTTPPANLHALVRAAEDFGKLPP